jgi:hypothetical protein
MEGSGSFLKKRTKKLSFTAAAGWEGASARRSKSFLPPGGPVLFFQKKKILTYC